ncbi:MAG: 16S rRNA (guanine(527)-N(7))-methyltransferase RsmG [Bacteroidaceae bacterium]|nr:16S rRNA (guanine(527)-N(7))-methyltransferase RsmG [Bacteroidaceae bacterium]MBQ5880898.1 16S rRNA (guanine(527)-N(7))-methyltransferase RsmG [Bacteroidaceae bacterium]
MSETARQQLQAIFDLFPQLTETQRGQLEALDALYRDWNAKINVISRKDIDNLYSHHVLHSLGIAKVANFRPGTSIMDVGTGGGFPGIPLAILYPECRFLLVDSIGKKIRVASDVIEQLGLTNVKAVHRNVMEEKGKYHFVVSRAVMDTRDLVRLVKKNISREQHNALPNGLICLKGGDLATELAPFKNTSEIWNLSDFFSDEFFETKQVIYVQL